MVAINGILGNILDRSLFADDLVIYISTKNQRVASRTLQEVTNKLDVWAVERRLTFSTKSVSKIFRMRNESIEIMLKNKIIPSKQSTQFLRCH